MAPRGAPVTVTAPGSPYRVLLAGPGALALAVASLPARLGAAMTGLGVVWLVHDATGSFARAGVVTGAYAVAAALAGPVTGRWHDRHGQRRVLPALLACYAVALALLIAAAGARAPLAGLAASGALLGAVVPQVGALAAARWSHLLGRGGREASLPTAFALEALATEGSFLVGPALVGTIAATAGPVPAMLLAGGLVLAGCLVLLGQRASTPPAAHERAAGSGAGPAATPAGALLRRLAAPLVLSAALGAFFGATQVSVTAFAVDLGRDAAAGPLYSLLAVGSVTGGLLHGHRRWRTPPRRQLDVVLPLLVIACVPLPLAASVPAMGAALVLPGLLVAPTIILASVLTQQTAPAASVTQSFTWLSSASATALAAGASLAGLLVDAHGSRVGLTVSLGVVLVAALLVSRPRAGRRPSAMLGA